jgi:hypothetical protein
LKINRKSKLKNLGVSYAISSVVITATTVVLVLVASNFAYQSLERQRGTAEFNLVSNILETYNDAVQDIAWSIKGSRNTRFSIDYGTLSLFPDNESQGLNLDLDVVVDGNTIFTENLTTGYLEYSIPTQFVSFAQREPFYLLGDAEVITTEGTDSFGRILISHSSEWVNAFVSYRVRVMETASISVGDDLVSYVNIWVIKLKIPEFSANYGEFDLTTNAYYLNTITHQTPLGNFEDFTLGAKFGNEPYSQKTIDLREISDQIVFNVIVSEVQVLP